ncbi:RHS repeat-associated core domain-containing protein [Microbulbifer sp. DLAB2-AA]|uniref:RHS repeat-associated core domain-containing protein n=1 Tax=Microbulbifer sp. DLAB2-AA TaxID=3243394 RepID=UPI00403933FF
MSGEIRQFTTNGDTRDQGFTYEYRVIACNKLECGTGWSNIKTIHVPLNVAAAGQFLDPTQAITIRPGTIRTLRATATDPNGISSANFYYGTTDLGQADAGAGDCSGDSSCFYLNPSFNAVGSGTLKLKVRDIYGYVSEITGHTLTVAENSDPIVLIDEVALPSEIIEGNPLTLRALVQDPDGNEDITEVTFLIDGAEVGNGVYVGDQGQFQIWERPQPWNVPIPSGDSIIFGVRAKDNEGGEAESYLQPKSVTHLNPPEPPTSLSVTGMTLEGDTFPVNNGDAITGASFSITWSPVADADYYVLQEGVNGSFTDSTWHNPPESLSVLIPPLLHGSYQYRVGACRYEVGCSGDDNNWSPVFTIQWVQYSPLTPENFSITPKLTSFDFTGSHTLKWDPVVTGYKPQDYRVFGKAGGIESSSPWTELGRITHSEDSGFEPKFSLQTLDPGTYSYQVQACNAEHSCSNGEYVSIDVLSPVLYNGIPNGNTIKLQGSGIDLDTIITLTDRKNGDQQVYPAGSSQITWHPPTDQDPATYATIVLSDLMEMALSDRGIRVSAENANSARAGVDVFANDKVERLSRIESGPTVGPNGIIYVGSGNKVFAINPEDGSTVPGWPFATEDLVKATPAVDAISGHIYVGSLDDSLYALSSSGLQKWRLATGGDIYASVVQDEDRNIYLGSMDGFIYSVQAENGAIRWTYNAGAGVAETPVLAGNGILYYTTVGSDQVYALGRGILGVDQLSWESMDNSLLKDTIEDLNWQPADINEPEYLITARLYRLLLQPPLSLSRDVLTFWTYALLNGASPQEVASAFLESDTGKSNFPPLITNEAFVDALYGRAFPGMDQPAFVYNGTSYTRGSLLDAMNGGMTPAEVAIAFAQSEAYVQATYSVLRNSFDYFYTQDYSWAVFACDDPEGTPETTDCDQDGLPDYWEILFFGDISTESGDTDADGDGITNQQAFNANIDPCANLCYYGVTNTPPEPAGKPTVPAGDIVNSGKIGSLPGQFRVNESGAATYQIPLSLPPGTAGVSPDLSLNYSSQNGNGLLGHGWTLTGLSAISRCRQTLTQDGQAKPITWSNQDRFCLDGQRLLVVSGSYGAPESVYQTEIDSFIRVVARGGSLGHPAYFTVERKDGSISYYGRGNKSQQQLGSNTLSWNISRREDSAGNLIEFAYELGGGHRIREISYGYTGSGSSAGAKVEFEYINRTDTISGYLAGYLLENTQLMTRINVYNRIDSNLQGVHSYEFDYLDDPRDLASRLEKIRLCSYSVCQPYTKFDWRLPVPGSIASSPTDLVVLSSQSDRTAVGARPADINGDGRKDIIWLEPDWDEDGKIDYQIFKYVLASEDGFGEEKTILQNNADVRNPFRWEILDFNLDGRADLAYYASNVDQWRVVLAAPDASGNWNLSGAAIDLQGLTDEDLRFLDINSDGLTDAVSSNGFYPLKYDPDKSPSSNNYYHFGSFQSFTLQGLESWDDQTSGGVEFYLDPNAAGDFDNDGRVDLILWHTKVVRSGFGSVLLKQYSRAYKVTLDGDDDSGYSLVNQGKVLDYQQEDSDFKSKNREGDATALDRHNDLLHKLHIADINGDGLADVLLEGRLGNIDDEVSEYSYSLSTGQGLTEEVQLGKMPAKAQLQWFDYDNDGALDLVWHDKDIARLYVRRWRSIDQQFSAPNYFLQTTGSAHAAHIFVDMNGDGVTDYLRIEEDMAYLYPATDFRVPVNVIEKITNGLGAETDINYGSLSNSGHYARLAVGSTVEDRCFYETEVDLKWCGQFTVADTASFYAALNDQWQGDQRLGKLSPTLELMGPMFVVTHVNSDAPIGNNINAQSSISYYYAQAKMQAGGRGLLGFAQLRTVDDQTGVETTTYYEQDFPFTGYPKRTEVKVPNGGNGILISESYNNWQLKNWQGSWGDFARENGTAELGPLQPILATSVERSYEIENEGNSQGALLKTVTTNNSYDDYGNPLQINVTTEAANGDRFVTATTNEYGPGTFSFPNTNRILNGFAELGRLTKTTVEHSRSIAGMGSDTETRISSFNYYESSDHRTGLLKDEFIEPGDPVFEVATHYDYDNFGNKIIVEQSVVDEPKRSTRLYYRDNRGRYLDREENSLGQITSKVLARNQLGLPTEVQGMALIGSDHKNILEYDPFGRQYLDHSPTGANTITLLSAASQHCPTGSMYQQNVTKGGGASSIICFDKLARETRSGTVGFDGQWVYSDTEYNARGLVERKSEPYKAGSGTKYWTKMTYDLIGRLVGTDLPGINNNNGTSYDLYIDYQGFTTVSLNPEGQSKTETKNAIGELITVVDNLGGRLEYQYDAQGNLRYVHKLGSPSDPHNLITEIKYDLLGRKTEMRDPDKGYWQYGYNGFGELIWQKDAKGQLTVNTYDLLGRQTSRKDYLNDSCNDVSCIEGEIIWTYNNSSGWSNVPPGALEYVIDSISGFAKIHGYDQYGRPSDQVTTFDILNTGDDHYEKITYDAYSRSFQQFDAGGDGTWRSSAIENRYNDFGYLKEVVDGENINLAAAQKFYSVQEMDERGNVTRYQNGNGVETSRTYDPATGRLLHQGALSGGVFEIQNQTYAWDSLGNLDYRHDQSGTKDLFEDFDYDDLNRLKSAQVTGRTAQAVQYDILGNITYKSDVGNYYYGDDSRCAKAAGPHALCQTSRDGIQTNYTYDANGNMQTGDGRTIRYTTFDKPKYIAKDGHSIEFKYGPSRSRYFRIDTDNSGGVTETRYIGSVEKITKPNGDREIKRYLPGGTLVTMSVESSGGGTSRETQYLHKDHLGSLDVITNSQGEISGSSVGNQHLYSFDVWGQRRNGLDWSVLLEQELSGFDTGITTRGYTGHEMLDQVGLIHMNGRIYDPKLGRFLQADPFIQAATDSQIFNRYSYVRNNPLNATDPSGYFVFTLGAMLYIAVAEGIKWYAVGLIMGAAGFVDAMMQGASFKDALKAGFIQGVSAAAFAAIVQGVIPGIDSAGVQVLASGVVGGITSVLQGGKFGHGFVSAGIGAAVAPGLKLEANGGWANVGKAVARITIAGTVSKATGGKFASGAAYAAFSVAIEASNLKSPPNAGRGPAKDINEEEMIKNRRLASRISHTEIADKNGNIVEVRTEGDIEVSMSWDLSKYGDTAVESLENIYQGSYVDENGVKHTLDIDFTLTDSRGDVHIKRGQCSLDYACGTLGGSTIFIDDVSAFWDPYAIPHEFGHNLGFHHFNPGNNALMSYDNIGVLQKKHIQLIEKYYYAE